MIDRVQKSLVISLVLADTCCLVSNVLMYYMLLMLLCHYIRVQNGLEHVLEKDGKLCISLCLSLSLSLSVCLSL